MQNCKYDKHVLQLIDKSKFCLFTDHLVAQACVNKDLFLFSDTFEVKTCSDKKQDQGGVRQW